MEMKKRSITWNLDWLAQDIKELFGQSTRFIMTETFSRTTQPVVATCMLWPQGAPNGDPIQVVYENDRPVLRIYYSNNGKTGAYKTYRLRPTVYDYYYTIYDDHVIITEQDKVGAFSFPDASHLILVPIRELSAS